LLPLVPSCFVCLAAFGVYTSSARRFPLALRGFWRQTLPLRHSPPFIRRTVGELLRSFINVVAAGCVRVCHAFTRLSRAFRTFRCYTRGLLPACCRLRYARFLDSFTSVCTVFVCPFFRFRLFGFATHLRVCTGRFPQFSPLVWLAFLVSVWVLHAYPNAPPLPFWLFYLCLRVSAFVRIQFCLLETRWVYVRSRHCIRMRFIAPAQFCVLPRFTPRTFCVCFCAVISLPPLRVVCVLPFAFYAFTRFSFSFVCVYITPFTRLTPLLRLYHSFVFCVCSCPQLHVPLPSCVWALPRATLNVAFTFAPPFCFRFAPRYTVLRCVYRLPFVAVSTHSFASPTRIKPGCVTHVLLRFPFSTLQLASGVCVCVLPHCMAFAFARSRVNLFAVPVRLRV